MSDYQSWARNPRVVQSVHALRWQDEAWPEAGASGLLPRGLGRSYGDVCLNEDGILLATAGMNRFLQFDPQQGLLRCEAGVSLTEILNLVVPRGWFLPVTPGTKFVSVGGAIANDVHGKNHHRAGSFGHYVSQLALRRSDGSVQLCSPTQQPELFQASIGGLGLTGLILWADIRLKKIPGPWLHQQALRFTGLEQFLALSRESDQDWEYTVAWIDCLARGRQLGRGIFYRANHQAEASAASDRAEPADYGRTRLKVPCNAPGFMLNPASIGLFNRLYYHQPLRAESRVHFDPFFYPLDKLAHWNRLYGRRGFFQYQCVIPPEHAPHAMQQILQTISASGQASFLSVLKMFGNQPSPGLLSFPRPGITLALDFAHKGDKTLALLQQLDAITVANDGAVYPAKDARMSSDAFGHYFPHWKTFQHYIDPAFSSSFWRRVTTQEPQP